MMVLAARERCTTMPRRFRLIPVDVEAIQLTDEDSLARAMSWSGGIPSDMEGVVINVPTASGVLRVYRGEYLIKGPDGTFYKMNSEEFEKHHELI